MICEIKVSGKFLKYQNRENPQNTVGNLSQQKSQRLIPTKFLIMKYFLLLYYN